MYILKYLLISIIFLTSCKDALDYNYYNESYVQKIICYNNGVIIFSGISAGLVTYSESGAITFVDSKTAKFKTITERCIVEEI